MSPRTTTQPALEFPDGMARTLGALLFFCWLFAATDGTMRVSTNTWATRSVPRMGFGNELVLQSTNDTKVSRCFGNIRQTATDSIHHTAVDSIHYTATGSTQRQSAPATQRQTALAIAADSTRHTATGSTQRQSAFPQRQSAHSGRQHSPHSDSQHSHSDRQHLLHSDSQHSHSDRQHLLHSDRQRSPHSDRQHTATCSNQLPSILTLM